MSRRDKEQEALKLINAFNAWYDRAFDKGTPVLQMMQARLEEIFTSKAANRPLQRGNACSATPTIRSQFRAAEARAYVLSVTHWAVPRIPDMADVDANFVFGGGENKGIVSPTEVPHLYRLTKAQMVRT